MVSLTHLEQLAPQGLQVPSMVLLSMKYPELHSEQSKEFEQTLQLVLHLEQDLEVFK